MTEPASTADPAVPRSMIVRGDRLGSLCALGLRPGVVEDHPGGYPSALQPGIRSVVTGLDFTGGSSTVVRRALKQERVVGRRMSRELPALRHLVYVLGVPAGESPSHWVNLADVFANTVYVTLQMTCAADLTVTCVIDDHPDDDAKADLLADRIEQRVRRASWRPWFGVHWSTIAAREISLAEAEATC